MNEQTKKQLFNELCADLCSVGMAQNDKSMKEALATLSKDAIDILAEMENKED